MVLADAVTLAMIGIAGVLNPTVITTGAVEVIET